MRRRKCGRLMCTQNFPLPNGRGTPGYSGKFAKFLRCSGPPARCFVGSRLYIIRGAVRYSVSEMTPFRVTCVVRATNSVS